MPLVKEQSTLVSSHLLPQDPPAQSFWAQRARAGCSGFARDVGASHREKTKAPRAPLYDRQLDTSLPSPHIPQGDAGLSPHAKSPLPRQPPTPVTKDPSPASTSPDEARSMHIHSPYLSQPMAGGQPPAEFSPRTHATSPPAYHSVSDGQWCASPLTDASGAAPPPSFAMSAKNLYMQAIGQSPAAPGPGPSPAPAANTTGANGGPARAQRIPLSNNTAHALPTSPLATDAAKQSDHPSPIRENGRRIYRPPHLRHQGSIGLLPPTAAHYDRVRSPSLMGTPRGTPRASLSQPLQLHDPPPPPQPAEASPWPAPATPDLLSPREAPSPLASPQTYDLTREASRPYLSRRQSSVAGEDEPSTTAPAPIPNHGISWGRRSWASIGSDMSLGLGTQDTGSWDGDGDDLDLFSDWPQGKDNLSLTDGYIASRRNSIASGWGMQDVVDIFVPGDRLAPGMRHDGCVVRVVDSVPGVKERICEIDGQLEVVRKLGEGSYACVYLVKNVKDTRSAERAPTTADVFGSTPIAVPQRSDDTAGNHPGDATVRADMSPFAALQRAEEAAEPRQFALKCLCKRDLTSAMVDVQKLEVSLHQSLPPHPNVVTLYCAYETPEWLFLVLEYCPGQDLYYWLEQAQDDVDAFNAANPAPPQEGGDTTVGGSTPRDPSLLSTTSGFSILSWHRVRLISRMFQQMCSSVQFCHDRGIAHRDLKPENFIVEDRRRLLSNGADGNRNDGKDSTVTDNSQDMNPVIVKLTDFGLATNEERCEDVGCGSRPYMSYECCNDVEPSYDPKLADVWSLGVILLNMLFHRSPFQEPSAQHCPSFRAFQQDPEEWLLSAFDGLTPSVASFLAKHVFTPASTGERVSAAELGAWAANLGHNLGLHGPSQRPALSRGASMGITTPLQPSRSRANSLYTYSRAPSMSSVLPKLDRVSLSSNNSAITSPISTRPSPRLHSPEAAGATHPPPSPVAFPASGHLPMSLGPSPHPHIHPSAHVPLGTALERTLRHVPSTVKEESVVGTPVSTEFHQAPPVPTSLSAHQPSSAPAEPADFSAQQDSNSAGPHGISRPVRPPRTARPPPPSSSTLIPDSSGRAVAIPDSIVSSAPTSAPVYAPEIAAGLPPPSSAVSQPGFEKISKPEREVPPPFLPSTGLPQALDREASARSVHSSTTHPEPVKFPEPTHIPHWQEEVPESSDDESASAAGSSKPRRRKRGNRKSSSAPRVRDSALLSNSSSLCPSPSPTAGQGSQPGQGANMLGLDSKVRKAVLPPKPLPLSDQTFSWRERGPLNGTTPRTSMSSMRSVLSDDQVSVYSAASAPAEIVRRSHDSSKIFRPNVALQPISETMRERSKAPSMNGHGQLDASFLAEMFGGSSRSSRGNGNAHGHGHDSNAARRRANRDRDCGDLSTHPMPSKHQPVRAYHSMEYTRPAYGQQSAVARNRTRHHSPNEAAPSDVRKSSSRPVCTPNIPPSRSTLTSASASSSNLDPASSSMDPNTSSPPSDIDSLHSRTSMKSLNSPFVGENGADKPAATDSSGPMGSKNNSSPFSLRFKGPTHPACVAAAEAAADVAASASSPAAASAQAFGKKSSLAGKGFSKFFRK